MFKRHAVAIRVLLRVPLQARCSALSCQAAHSRRFTSSADPKGPSLSASEADLLRRVHYLREQAIDMERRVTRVLEQAGELPPPATPLAAVAPQHVPQEEVRERIVDNAAQPSLVADMTDWLEDAMQRVKAAERRLLDFTRAQRQPDSGRELDELACEADELHQQARLVRDKVNAEVRQEGDTDVRLGPIPVPIGPEEPVWIAVPLRGEGEEGEQRAEEQAGSGAQQEKEQRDMQAAETKENEHIHGRLPEDRATGHPEKETGVSNTPQAPTTPQQSHNAQRPTHAIPVRAI